MEIDFPWHSYFGDEIWGSEDRAEPFFRCCGIKKGGIGEEEGMKEGSQVVGTGEGAAGTDCQYNPTKEKREGG